jgi:tetratricopeptide (TPR) repeat protein
MHHPAENAIEKKAWLLFGQDKWAEASAIFEDLLKAYPSSEGALQGEIACLRKQRQFDKALQLLKGALKKKHPQSIGLLAEKAWLNVDSKHYDAAIYAFKVLLAFSSSHKDAPQHFSWLIDLLRLQRRFGEADTTLQQALQLFPGDYSLRSDQAWLYFYQDDYARAAKLFEDLLREKKGDATAIQGKLASLRMIGAFDEATREASAALTQVGRQPGVLNEMAWVCSEKGNDDQGSRLFEEVLTLTPKDPYAYLNLACSLIREGGTDELEKASQRSREALSLDPDLPQARGCLGVVAFKQGRLGRLRRNYANQLTIVRLTEATLIWAHSISAWGVTMRLSRYSRRV